MPSSPTSSSRPGLAAAAAARPEAADALLAAVLAVATLVPMLAAAPDRDVSVAPGVTWPAAPLALLMTLPIAARRRHPIAVLVVVGAADVAAGLLGYSTGVAALALVLALATASYVCGRRSAVAAGAVALVVLPVAYAVLPSSARDGSATSTLVFSMLVVVLALVTGDVLRGHREALAALESRNRELELLRDVEKREAVAQDRVRIAREVHDIVGHALAAITLQARGGQRLADRDPARTRESLRQIEEVAARALEETRQAVGVIRSAQDRDALQPQPRLSDLPSLVAAVSTESLRVSLRSELAQDPGALPDSVQASAYRIVQESLANVVKHAAAGSAEVVLASDGDGALHVRVRDDGRAVAAPPRRVAEHNGSPSGQGLVGMRARAAQVGGTLEAGPVDGGGWLVDARLPGTARA